ncbi:MAG: hypothetical protein ACSHX5_12125 [Phycisphaerales bacterium]
MSVLLVPHAADAILEQLDGFIDQLSDDQFVQESTIFPGGTAGKHIRHTLDHFKAAITTCCTETIDYDHRERGVNVESDRNAAKSEIAQLRSCLCDLSEDHLTTEVTTRVMCSGNGQCAELTSTRGREIFFAMHHSIHHNAILKAIAAELDVELDKSFGLAPSTINFESGLASS